MNTDVIRIRDMMEDYARLCVSYAYGNNVVDKRDGVSDDIMAAVEAMASDRDTLATGVEEYHCRLPAHRDEAVLKAALEVTRRLKAASEPAKPPPAATAEPEYDLVEVHPDGRAWRYRPGLIHGDYTNTFPTRWHHPVARCDVIVDGAIRFSSMPAALAWWRATHPEPANPEPAQPAAQPTGKMTLADRLAEMRHEVDGVLKRGGSSHITEIINAIHVTARVVEALAKEAKQ